MAAHGDGVSGVEDDIELASFGGGGDGDASFGVFGMERSRGISSLPSMSLQGRMSATSLSASFVGDEEDLPLPVSSFSGSQSGGGGGPFEAAGAAVTAAAGAAAGSDVSGGAVEEDLRLSARLQAAQHFRGSQVSTANVCHSSTSSDHGRHVGSESSDASGLSSNAGGGGENKVNRPIDSLGDWEVFVGIDPDKPYYHNSKTGETTWEKPDGGTGI